MKRYAVLGIIIALVVSIAAIGCSSGGSSGPTPQPKTATPTQQATQQPTSEPTETQEANEAATATSLDFTVEYALEGMGTYTYRYMARNIGTSSLDIRIEWDSEQVDAKYILKGSTRQGWVYTGDQWIEFTTMYQDFDEFWDAFYESFEGYQTTLAEEWTGVQGWTYSFPGMGTVTYSNIDINPSLPDSVFQPD